MWETMVDSPRRKGNDPLKYVLQLPRVYWTIDSTMQYIGRPHSYMSCLSLVFMTDVNRGLTRDELTAIVSMMLIRLNHEPFRKCKVHPVSDSIPMSTKTRSNGSIGSGLCFFRRPDGENYPGLLRWRRPGFAILTTLENCGQRVTSYGTFRTLSLE